MSRRSELLQRTIKAMLDAGVRRTTCYPLVSESLELTRDRPRQIRRALAFAHLLDNVDQVVLPYELLAGSITGMWPLSERQPTLEQHLSEGRRVLCEYRERRRLDSPATPVGRSALMARDHYDSRIRFSDLQQVAGTLARELDGNDELPYAELYRVLEDHFVFDYGEQVEKNLSELPWFAANHLCLGFRKALGRGMNGLRQEIVARGARAGSPPQLEFYDAALIAVDAAVRFIRRYARTLTAAGSRSESERAGELTEMAATCDAIAEEPPRTFRQALQLVWMIHLISNIGGGSAMSFGRFDQYLHPCYQRDLSAGRLTPGDARELVAHLWLKANEPKMRTVQSLALSGIDRDGGDGTNDLTYLCLDVIAEVREPYPNTCVRLHKDSPPALWDRVIDTILLGIGQPQIFNDDAMLSGLRRAGFPAEDARDYYPMGCVEVMLEGLQPTYQGMDAVVFTDPVLAVLGIGSAALRGTPGRAAGDPGKFDSFDSILEACLTELRRRVKESIRKAEDRCREGNGGRYDPFASIFVDDCLEAGKDVCQGGARYSKCFTLNGMGFGTAIDSLAAIKTFVFDRGQYSLRQVREMLERNFAGDETARALLHGHRAAWGNDDGEADCIARRIYGTFVATIIDHRSPVGAIFLPQMFSYTSHLSRGETTAATSNGRRRGEALSDGPGPTQGKDVGGPTCLINSITGIDGSRLIGGCGFNMKISQDFVRGDEGRIVLKSLLQTYLARNGMQIQVNMIDQETLRKAQEAPELHRDVIVRVAGYCEYFTNLDRRLQDEIISRTLQRFPASNDAPRCLPGGAGA